MRDLFPGYYLPSEVEFKKLWREGLFILDTNVLLNLYRFPDKARADFLNVLRHIAPRLWIPFQVALEYQRNRLSVMSEQRKAYDEVEDIISKSLKQLRDKLSTLNLPTRHPSINPTQFLQEVNVLFERYAEELRTLKQKERELTSEDPIRDAIHELLGKNVGSRPSNQEELDAIFKEGEDRYQRRIPPGHLDADKSMDKGGNRFVCGELVYQKEYGDLILWKQIINYARKEGKKYIVYVTDDSTDDWWHIVDKKTIGPRPELVEEIKQKGGVELFYMYGTERFMKFARTYLQVSVPPESISQVSATVHDEQRKRAIQDFAEKLFLPQPNYEDVVRNWLRARHPGDRMSVGLVPGDPDIVFTTRDGQTIAYEVKVLTAIGPKEVERLISSMGGMKYLHNEVHIVIVARSTQAKAAIDKIEDWIKKASRFYRSLPDSLIAGTVENFGEGYEFFPVTILMAGSIGD
ncbi:MAG TPA: PIN domain-containing protein [Nitrospira sp.]|nr:PIN domain-containing protein [Nitrospira sp.]HNG02930.1 PIN domain-containing protein [Nitrospira sp.]HNJ18304.1 PIN domain-containing protein [Nitrospira sp.]HNK49874.1 PIN domain-containing protein [Nitrospira sp.]HNM19948.1 PIN domain-containing protein [Nitrospira sp.]